ncbi:MAG TPA: tRNA lysidine(34) synthetase TilS [Rhizomicrobium sp.]|nr:tRNA lysidine(34) synthetase TilS [Rhizomicrobium sp.]
MSTDSLAADFDAAMARSLAHGAPWPGAVAVSGGGDSKALMLLLAEWARAQSRTLPIVLTVDHGLVPGAARIAQNVVKDAHRIGLKAHRLVWKGIKPSADIEAAARTARYHLMGRWCEAHGVKGLYVAHTLEDQAETFLLRLARGSGLDGLAAMRTRGAFPAPGFERLCVVRPLLKISRTRLRGWLESRRESWVDDPMNADPRFARTRIRKAWPALAAAGLSPVRIAAAADHLGRARDALEDATAEVLEAGCRFEGARVLVDGARLAAAPPEIGLRALAHILSHVSGQAYRPRFERLERLYRAIAEGELKSARTLHGCRIGRARKDASIFGPFTLIIVREPVRRRAGRTTVAVRDQIS